MYNNRDDRRYRHYRILRGLATGLFFISLAFAFYFSEQFGWHLFVPILFAGWAFVSLFVAASSGNPRVLYGGLHSFTWLLSLGILSSPWVSFWPWILIPVGVSCILGALYTPITTGLYRSGFVSYAPPPQYYQQPYPPYQDPPQPKQQDNQSSAESPQPEETPVQQR